tara:strand:- start:493 stop:645 length:153 start_codon:yes stop_codon:yes gene_type:complete
MMDGSTKAGSSSSSMTGAGAGAGAVMTGLGWTTSSFYMISSLTFFKTVCL